MCRECLINEYISANGKIVNLELAEFIVRNMTITDGSGRKSGERFTVKEAEKLGEKVSIDFQDVKLSEWYVVLNMMYQQHFQTACLFRTKNPLFYASLAADWFRDIDASEGKTFNFFMTN